MILMTHPFNGYHVVTFTVDLSKGQISCRAANPNSLILLVGVKKDVSRHAWIERSGILEHRHTFLGHRSRRLHWPIVIMRFPSSIVCPPSVRRLTFSTSSSKPLDGFWWNLVCMKYSMSLTIVVVFGQIRPGAIKGNAKLGQGGPLLQKNPLQTGRLQQQTEYIVMI